MQSDMLKGLTALRQSFAQVCKWSKQLELNIFMENSH